MAKYTCLSCGNQFVSYNPEPKFCSRKCRGFSERLPIDEKRAIELYLSGQTQDEVAQILGSTQKVVYSTLKRNGIKSRKAAKRYQDGPNNHMWNGGVTIRSSGYIAIKNRDHHRADSKGYVLEHILVAEQKLGRKLRWLGPGHPLSEIVHHLNGDKTDNRPENIAITTFTQHLDAHRNELGQNGGVAR